MAKVYDVFVSVGFPKNTYIERGSLDRTVESWKHNRARSLLIFGPSKSGKTSLWKRHIHEKDVLKVGCNATKTIGELYREVLFELNAQFESAVQSGDSAKASLSAGIKALFGQAQASVEGQTSNSVTNSPVSAPPLTANVVTKFLKASGRTIVLEDFHYASDELKQGIAQDLKAFSDDNCGWIVVGVQHKTSELLSYNTDLALRISELPVEGFSAADLKEIIKKGEEALNISISGPLQERILSEADGSASLLQAVCLRLCQLSSVLETRSGIVEIRDSVQLEKAFKETAEEQKTYYQKLVRHVSQGGRSDGTTEKYKWFLKMIRDRKVPDSGLKNTEVYHYLVELGHPNIDQGSVTSGLGYLPTLLTKANFPSFFDFDPDSKMFYLMDKQMRFVFKWIPELVDDLFRPT